MANLPKADGQVMDVPPLELPPLKHGTALSEYKVQSSCERSSVTDITHQMMMLLPEMCFK